MQRTAVLNVVGLTPSLIGADTPNLRGLASQTATIRAVTPAVTCSAQATYLTGNLPREHGIVGNGWFFRDLAEVWFWRQSNRLVQGPQIWHEGRRQDPDFTCANLFWWYNMATDVDWSMTPRPLYLADGRKLPDCASDPPGLRQRFTNELGRFPLFQFWGPATSIASSRWIAEAAMGVEEAHHPTLNLVYLPHLDYVLQREGPGGAVGHDLREIDGLVGGLLDFFRERGVRVVVLSEYGITPVSRVVHPNRRLRKGGFLAVKEDLGREYLDPTRGRAFAVADHQIAHVYVEAPEDVPAVRELFEGAAGVERVLDRDGQREFGLDHPRSGELVLVAEADTWFSYYFWEDERRAPDYAHMVDIHRKPGYDPCELFLDPALRWPRVSVGWRLLKKTLGFRTVMDVIPVDPSLVRGSHGRPTDDPAAGPLFLTTEPRLLEDDRMDATAVQSCLLDHVFTA